MRGFECANWEEVAVHPAACSALSAWLDSWDAYYAWLKRPLPREIYLLRTFCNTMLYAHGN